MSELVNADPVVLWRAADEARERVQIQESSP